MITIKKTGEGYYLVSIPGKKEELGRHECHEIRHELSPIIKPHREITMDLRGVKKIQRSGYQILEELKSFTNQKNCKLKFINADPTISGSISLLNAKKVLKENEHELL